MTTPYKRPAMPPPEDLAKRTASLRARLDSHAANMGLSVQRPLHASELAGSIKETNEARAARQYVSEVQESAKQELLIACDCIRDNLQSTRDEGRADGFHDGVDMFTAAVKEFLTALSAQSPQKRADALQAMRENVASLDRYRGVK